MQITLLNQVPKMFVFDIELLDELYKIPQVMDYKDA
jgi:hypothetical protein